MRWWIRVLRAHLIQWRHPHAWTKELDLDMDLGSIRAPYIEICGCGATRLRETSLHG